jgi:MFS family permease
MVIESVPPADYPKYGAMVVIVVAIAMLVGPIIGGAVSSAGLWRWVFLIKSVHLDGWRCLN